jgi:hypothetical protein
VKHARFIVADELVLYRAPNLARDDAVLLGDVMNLAGDHAKDPGEDDTLHVLPSKVVVGRGIREDVVGEVVVL